MQIQLLYLINKFRIVTNIAHFLTGGDGNIGAMIEIFESSYTPTISQDIFDGIKRKVMQTLEEGSYLSPFCIESSMKNLSTCVLPILFLIILILPFLIHLKKKSHA